MRWADWLFNFSVAVAWRMFRCPNRHPANIGHTSLLKERLSVVMIHIGNIMLRQYYCPKFGPKLFDDSTTLVLKNYCLNISVGFFSNNLYLLSQQIDLFVTIKDSSTALFSAPCRVAHVYVAKIICKAWFSLIFQDVRFFKYYAKIFRKYFIVYRCLDYT